MSYVWTNTHVTNNDSEISLLSRWFDSNCIGFKVAFCANFTRIKIATAPEWISVLLMFQWIADDPRKRLEVLTFYWEHANHAFYWLSIFWSKIMCQKGIPGCKTIHQLVYFLHRLWQYDFRAIPSCWWVESTNKTSIWSQFIFLEFWAVWVQIRLVCEC